MDQILSARDCIVKGEFIYYYVAEIGWIVQMEKKSGRLQYVLIQEHQRTFQADCCTCVGNSLYFLSMDGTCMLEYDLDEERCHRYGIGCEGKPDGNFLTVLPMENAVYIFTRYKKQVMIFDCISKGISVCQYPKSLRDTVFQSVCLQNEKAWMFSDDGKAVSFDMKACQWDLLDMEIKNLNLVHAAAGQEMIYLLSREGNVYVWETEQKKACCCEMEKCEQRNESYIRMVLAAPNRCVLLPSIGNYIEMYDLNTGKLVSRENITDGRKKIEGRDHWSAFRGYGEDSEWYYFVSHAYKEYLKISKHTGELCWNTPQYPSEPDWIKCRIDSGEGVFDEREDRVIPFFNSLQRKGIQDTGPENGKKIWSFCSDIE